MEREGERDIKTVKERDRQTATKMVKVSERRTEREIKTVKERRTERVFVRTSCWTRPALQAGADSRVRQSMFSSRL